MCLFEGQAAPVQPTAFALVGGAPRLARRTAAPVRQPSGDALARRGRAARRLRPAGGGGCLLAAASRGGGRSFCRGGASCLWRAIDAYELGVAAQLRAP